MLFDMMMEEAFAQIPEERSPAITYDVIWETLQDKAGGEEKKEYARLLGDLEPGKVHRFESEARNSTQANVGSSEDFMTLARTSISSTFAHRTSSPERSSRRPGSWRPRSVPGTFPGP